MSREKGLLLGSLYDKIFSDNHRKDTQINCWNAVAVALKLESGVAE